LLGVCRLGKFGFKDGFDNYRALASESVSSLNIEASVKYRGVPVGRVSDIRISTENTEQIEILLTIFNRFDSSIANMLDRTQSIIEKIDNCMESNTLIKNIQKKSKLFAI
jgi:ABC-type transporter Mla subunit MlaD